MVTTTFGPAYVKLLSSGALTRVRRGLHASVVPPLALALLSLLWSRPSAAVEPASCRAVRLADIGWTDVTATTAVTALVLAGLGYQPRVQLLSVPVTFASMRSGDVDVFLGAWLPSMRADIAPYLLDGSVEQVRVNLDGAKYTLAVPDYVREAGVRDFADLQRFSDRFDRRIYGIEPGNDGNRIASTMIERNAFGLRGWRLVESSEQGMLTQVTRAISARDWIVFLGWEPHPMNLRWRLAYLTGGDEWFGPHYGGAQVWTIARRGYTRECDNVGRLLHNLRFDLALENALMEAILSSRLAPDQAARGWLRQHPEFLAEWLDGVTTSAGGPARAAVEAHLGLAPEQGWLPRLPLGRWAEQGVGFLTTHFHAEIRSFAAVVEAFLGRLIAWLAAIPPLALIAAVCVISFVVQRSWRRILLMAGGLLLILALGYWRQTLETAALVLVSAGFSILVGVPAGIVAAHRPWLYVLMRPFLDLMQTIPTFVYLIPALMLFGLGLVPGVIATVVFALPAPIRLTYLGVRGVPAPLREAGLAFGATPFALLFKVELPHARSAIMAGATECIMLSLSMVVIAALVGAQGLGEPVVRALNTVNIAQGFEAGLAIVILAIVLDRMLRRSPRQGPNGER
jgi:glycine betaine/proline transport system substrate-binding protein